MAHNSQFRRLSEEMANLPGELSGKVIVVTGGAQGIGGATARICAERGARVVIADWNGAAAEAHAAALRAEGCDVIAQQVDVGEPRDVQQLMDVVDERYGRLDVMVCAAGIFRGAFQPPDELEIEDFDAVIRVNVRGVYLCSKYAVPLYEKAERGVFIIVGSGAGVTGASGSLAYGASKGGANGYGMTLARHIADRNVRVNVICPGGINTELKLGVVAAQAQREARSVDGALDEAKQQLGSPDGVGRVIAFLASDEADYVKGTLFTR
jgi:NAD(P)-dependent dehydrogenase (short-subunit alcohol dehydrogenase family)